MRGLRPWALLLAVCSGCEVQEITIPQGERVPVVQGVLNLAHARQTIVVEWSLTGAARVGDPDSIRGQARPDLPISLSRVVIARDDGDSVVVPESAVPGLYKFDVPSRRGFLAAARRYALRVETPDGGVVRGWTRMPDFPEVAGMPAEGAAFNRDRDSLALSWRVAPGTKGVFVQVRPVDLDRHPTLIFVTDSTRVTIPGRLADPFHGDTIPPAVFVAGSWQIVTVAAQDTNFFDFIRSANNPFTGDGFLNRLEGGLGVFGAVAPVNRTLRVVADVDHPFEGRYALRAQVGDDSVDAVLELYVTRDRPEPVLVNAFVEGTEGPAAPRPLPGGGRRAIWMGEVAGWVENGRLHLRLSWREDRAALDGPFDLAGGSAGTVRDRSLRPVGAYTLRRAP